MKNPKIAFYSANGFQETFTQAHLLHLNVTFKITGGTPPRLVNDKPMISMSFKDRLKRKLFPREISPLEPLENFLSGNKVDVFVAEFGMAGAVVTDSCKKYNIPLIVNFYGVDAFGRETINRFKDEYQRMFVYARFVCAQSNSIREQLIRLGCAPEKIIVNPGPPDNSFFSTQSTTNEPVLISVGRFVDKKAPFANLMAFRKVRDQFPNAKLIMAGDGPLLFSSKKIAELLGLSDAVEFVGRITPEQQRKYMEQSKVFIQHSIVSEDGDSEGLPVAIMEASAMGLPVVSTFHSGIPEAIEHGVTGLLVKELDVDAMADYIIRLLVSPEQAQEMGRKGREKMMREFTMEKHINTLDKLIRLAINE